MVIKWLLWQSLGNMMHAEVIAEVRFMEKQWKINFSHTQNYLFNVWWVPCHHGMARPQVADGG
jgi:hypothetical protein